MKTQTNYSYLLHNRCRLDSGRRCGRSICTPKSPEKQTTIRNVLVLPAKVEIVKQGMRGPEGMAAESELLSTRVEQLVIESLTAKHVDRNQTGASTSPAAGGAQKKYLLADMQTRYDALTAKDQEKTKRCKEGRFSLGDEILNLKPG